MGGTPERYAALKSGTIAASMLSAPHSLRAEKEGFTKLRGHPRLRQRVPVQVWSRMLTRSKSGPL